jgi:hypothetical protein
MLPIAVDLKHSFEHLLVRIIIAHRQDEVYFLLLPRNCFKDVQQRASLTNPTRHYLNIPEPAGDLALLYAEV